MNESRASYKLSYTRVSCGQPFRIVPQNRKDHMRFYRLEFNCQLTFQPSLTYVPHVNGLVSALAIADLDKDGDLDLVVADRRSYNIDTLFGNVNGTFGEQTTYSTGDGNDPVVVAVGDVNNDGQVDLVVSTSISAIIDIRLGYRNGSFGSGKTFSTAFVFSAEAVVIGHFNEDGHVDLAIGANGVCLMFGDGNGEFSEPRKIPSSALSYGTFVATGDFNNDHQIDLVALDFYEHNAEVLLNRGSGYFEVSTRFSTGPVGSTPSSLALADFNNDTRLDMVIVDYEKDRLLVFLGHNNGTFREYIIYPLPIYTRPNSVVAGDFNHDGWMDLAVTYENAHNVSVWLGVANGTFLSPTLFSTGTDSMPTKLAKADFNHDGRLDLAIIDKKNNKIVILTNTCDCCTGAALIQP